MFLIKQKKNDFFYISHFKLKILINLFSFSNFFMQVLGFVVGPGLQAAVTPFGAKGFTFLGLPFNMYTMCGWINVALGIVNIIFFLPWYFKERHIAAREAMINQGKTSGNVVHNNIVSESLKNEKIGKAIMNLDEKSSALFSLPYCSLHIILALITRCFYTYASYKV